MILAVVNPFSGFEYMFFNRAFIALILLSLILPILGVRLAGKGYSMIADTLSHTSLAGIAIGIVCGGVPTYFSIIFSIVCAVIIELIRRKLPKYSGISLTIVLALSLGLVGILQQFAQTTNFETYLFGSLLTITNLDLIILGIVVGVAIIYEIFFRRSNIKISYNEDEAKANGLKVQLLSIIDMVVISVVVAVACNIIGALLVTSFISIPVAISLKLGKSSRTVDFFAIIFSFCISIVGLFVGYAFDIHIGGIIVIIGIAFLLLVLLIEYLINRSRKKN